MLPQLFKLIFVSLWKRLYPFIKKNLVSFTQEHCVTSSRAIGPVVFKKEVEKLKTDGRTDGEQKVIRVVHLSF